MPTSPNIPYPTTPIPPHPCTPYQQPYQQHQGLRARPQEINSVPAWAQQRLEHGELSLVRPDALINGVASLLAGVSISLLMIWHDEEVLSATWALIIWVAIGAPCCVVGICKYLNSCLKGQ